MSTRTLILKRTLIIKRTLGVFGLALALLLGGDASAKRSKLAGKLFFSATKIKDSAPAELERLFAGAKPRAELKRKDNRWNAVAVGFFRRPAIDGPVTLWFFDKSDKAALKKREAMHIATAHGGAKGKYFVYDLELDENDGFNKKRTYVIKVGQIVRRRTKIYATGEVKLLP